MGMTLMERDNFRQKMLDEYGPGWESIVKEYKERSTPRFGPHADYRGMSVNPDNFRTDNPLSLLSSREDIELALREPTKQDWINELDRMDSNRLQGPVRPPMEMRTHGVPINSNEIIPYHAESFQNRISPLPHQLEGPETAIGPMMVGGPPDMYGRQMAHRGSAYDPNQELYNPNYYGTEGQMGEPLSSNISSSFPGVGAMSDVEMHPYSQAMPSIGLPGLLDSGEQFSQAFPGPDPEPDEDWQKQEWDNQLAGPLAETGEGGKWEPKGDSIYRRKRKDGMDDYLAKYIMGLGDQISGGATKWR